MRLIRSQFLRSLESKPSGDFFIYHTLFGNPRIVNTECFRFLNIFDGGANNQDVEQLVSGDPSNILQDLMSLRFVLPVGMDERGILSQLRRNYLQKVSRRETIDHISLSVSNECNFRCAHCMFYQSEGNRGKNALSSGVMNWETAKKCLDLYFQLIREAGNSVARIHFGNAEPLLNWKVIRSVLEYCEPIRDLRFEFAINTNLWLLNEEIASLLKKYQVKIATSVDGIGEANDSIRVTKSGGGTFARLIEKFDLLQKIDYPLDGVSVTVTEKNFYKIGENIVKFAAARHMKSLAFDYDLINLTSIPVDERVSKVIHLRHCAEDYGIYFGGTWGAPFRKLMSSSILEKFHAFCSAAEARGLTFNCDGKIKACDYSSTVIGDVDYLDEVFTPDGGLYQFVASHLPGVDHGCLGCSIEGMCAGHCYITHEVAAAENQNDLLEDMCRFYRAMTDTLIREHLNDARRRNN